MKNILENVMSDVIGKKAEGDLILNTSKSLKLSAQENTLAEYKVSSAQVLGLRLIKDGRVGISYTESLDADSLKLMVKQALDNAETNDVALDESILAQTGEIHDVAKYANENVAISDKIENVLKLESEVKKKDPRVIACPHNGFTEGEYSGQYLNSKGRHTTYWDRSYTIWTSALMGNAEKKSTYYDFNLSHDFKSLDWDLVINNSLYHAQQLLDEKPLPTGKYQIKFSEDSLKDLMDVFSNLYSAKSAIDKVNPWATQLGELVISKDLTIEDHPTFERAFRKSLFDSEGMERRPLTLVKDGVLKSFYHNSATARHFKVAPTGHGSRGPQSALNVGGTHILIHGKNPKSLPTNYLEVIQLDGLHAGTNRITGDFSLPVKGYLWERGEKVMAFGNVTLSGNFFTMLKNLEVCGKDLLSSTDQSFFSVPLIFNDLSIAGV